MVWVGDTCWVFLILMLFFLSKYLLSDGATPVLKYSFYYNPAGTEKRDDIVFYSLSLESYEHLFCSISVGQMFYSK
jgi:hypothetical protein